MKKSVHLGGFFLWGNALRGELEGDFRFTRREWS